MVGFEYPFYPEMYMWRLKHAKKVFGKDCETFSILKENIVPSGTIMIRKAYNSFVRIKRK